MTGGEIFDVLVLEDNPDLRETLKKLLTHEGYTVRVAGDEAEALKILGGPARPRLILLELVMPRLDGERFVARCKSDPDFRDIPLVVLTGSMRPALFERLAVSEILSKPLSLRVLLNVVRKYCRPEPEVPPAKGSPEFN